MARFTRLAPMPVDLQLVLAQCAAYFFNPMVNAQVRAELNLPVNANEATGLTFMQFLNWLNVKNVFADMPEGQQKALQYQNHIWRILNLMVQHQMLTAMTNIGVAKYDQAFWAMGERSKLQGRGWVWLSPVLGPTFLNHQCRPGIVQIAGVDKAGNPRSGTGLVVAPYWVLTCAHVLRDMRVDDEQVMQGQTCRVVDQRIHPSIDVGLLAVDVDVQPVPGLAFREPQLLDKVWTLGYPVIPQARQTHLVMQSGEVTVPLVNTVPLVDTAGARPLVAQAGEVSVDNMVDYWGQHLFLFSAIARPGNSGGPILSEDGYVVGIVAEDKLHQGAGEFVMPFYAGVPTSEVVRAVNELHPELSLPVEDWE